MYTSLVSEDRVHSLKAIKSFDKQIKDNPKKPWHQEVQLEEREMFPSQWDMLNPSADLPYLTDAGEARNARR